MKSKSLIFSIFLVFIIVLSVSTISAQDVNDTVISDGEDITNQGSVSGGVDVITENPWETTGELNYDIPSEAKDIKKATVYVNVYGGSAQNTYGANANVSINTANGDKELASEQLWIEDGSADGTVYQVNDHVTKCYSDYMMCYDVTDSLKNLNGTHFKLNVKTFAMDGKQFDGRIKLLGLILAYDDGDDDIINYWINDDQLWSKNNVSLTFNTAGLTNVVDASLTNVVLSSADGVYRINDELLGDSSKHASGNYYQYNKWDNIHLIENQNTVLNVAYAGTSSYGSIKNVFSVLTVKKLDIAADITIKTEYTSVPSAYAGTNNTLTVKVNTNKAGKYVIKLLADGIVVNQTEIDLVSGDNNLLITDPTIRSVDELTVNGAENNKVNYTIELVLGENAINCSSITVPILYNGNLGKDLAYPSGGFGEINKFIISGDIVIEVKNVTSYLGSGKYNREDVWTINLDKDSNIVKSFIYVPYNWFNPNLLTEDINMFNATFNGFKVTPVAFYRDQGNLGNYGKYGYGVLVYDVSDLINKSGDNSFNLTKLANTPAVYPSALVYMYNTTGSKVIKEVYITEGADLLANSNNNAKRPVHADSIIDVDLKDSENAELYIFAASAQSGEGNIIFNGESYENVWNGASSTTDLYALNITKTVKDSNKISFVATGSTILALNQIIVLTKTVKEDVKPATAPTQASNPTPAKKLATKITAKKKTFKAKTKVKKYTITLKAGKKAVKKVKVTIKIGKKTYTAKTNSKGKATFKIKKLTKKGKYKAVIKFKGNKNYKSSSKKVKITIK